MLVSANIGQVASSYIPGLGEEVYDTRTGEIYRGNSYTAISGLTPVNSGIDERDSLFLNPGTTHDMLVPESLSQDEEFLIELPGLNIPSWPFTVTVYLVSYTDVTPVAAAAVDIDINYLEVDLGTQIMQDPVGGTLLGSVSVNAAIDDTTDLFYNATTTEVLSPNACDSLYFNIHRAAADAYGAVNIGLQGIRLNRVA